MRGRRSLLLAALWSVASSAPPALAQVDEAPAFSIRADPSAAAAVNRVLATYARNVFADVPAGVDIAEFLKKRCGGSDIPEVVSEAALPSGKRRVEFIPCVRLGGTRTVTVEPGLTLEAIAARWGLRADKTSQFTILAGEGNPDRSSIKPNSMLPGDRVVLPQTSLWTEIKLKADSLIGRSNLLSAIGDALGCTGDYAACVRGKGVLILSQGQSSSPAPPPQPQPPPPAGSELDSGGPGAPRSLQFALSNPSGLTSRSVAAIGRDNSAPVDPARIAPMVRLLGINTAYYAAPFAVAVPADAQAAAPAAAASSGAAPTGIAAASVQALAASVGTGGVAPDQWPYDVKRITAVLTADKAHLRDSVVIGIADGGLASVDGAPLPLSVLAPNPGEMRDGEKNQDDDDNYYVDDIYGAGLRRADDSDLNSDMLGTGKLDLCPTKQDYVAWAPTAVSLASHGSVVSSIAAAWPVRGAHPDAWPSLPKIAFYRMLTQECSPDSQFTVKGAEINKALRYLFGRSADVVNLSYKIAIRAENEDLIEAAKAQLNGDSRMLVVAAGNGDGVDLDEGKLCPACLGNPGAAGPDLPLRVMVVGAADRTLKASPGSNQGVQTVRFYAPGQPAAIDILGRPVADRTSSTSFAAPLGALAVGMLKALGVTNYWEITERIDAASWPLVNEDGSASPSAKVIDLTKVVAVYRDVIESTVVEDGAIVRRDYVGQIVEPASDLGICSNNFTFKRATMHSVRLWPVAADGTRRARVEERWTGSKFPQRDWNTCRSSGSVTIDDVVSGRITIPLEKVNQILLSWK